MGKSDKIPTKVNKRLIEIRNKLLKDENYVFSKRYDFDINKVLEKHPNGCSDKMIASLLQLDLEDVSELYQEILEKLKKEMLVDE